MKFAFLRGGALGAERRIIQNTVFVGNALKVQMVSSRNVVIAPVLLSKLLLLGSGSTCLTVL